MPAEQGAKPRSVAPNATRLPWLQACLDVKVRWRTDVENATVYSSGKLASSARSSSVCYWYICILGVPDVYKALFFMTR